MFISRQKIKFILHIFLEILQRYLKLIILGTLGMYDYALCRQSDTSNLQKTFVFICRQKINFIAYGFLEILQRYANFLFWVLWACLVWAKWHYQLVANFDVYPHAKNKLDHSLLEIYILNNSAIWLANSIWANNLRIRILPDMGWKQTDRPTVIL